MAIIDNTLAAQVPTFDPATPLAQASKLQGMEIENRQAQFKQAQLEIGAEARGLQTFVNTPEFATKWGEAADRMYQKGLLDERAYKQWRNTPSPLLLKSMIASTSDPTLDFRRERAAVEDKQWSAEHALKQRTAGRLENPTPEGFERADGGMRPVAGGPADPAYIDRVTDAKKKTDFAQTIDERKKAAANAGLDTSSPGYQSFVLTGKMPREDAQPLTATDKKAILEADEMVLSNQAAIDSLNRAKTLSKDAFAGPLAGKIGYATSFLGESSDLGKSGSKTLQLENEITSNSLSQLKAIFGGAPTEGERKILLDIQGSASKPDKVRQEIYDRAIELAGKRLDFNKRRADELRGGQFYKPQGSMSRAPAAQNKGITQDEYEKLPSGTKFIAPDGTERIKP
jgi:hypothetical protein